MSDGTVLERLVQIEPEWADVERRSRNLRKQHLHRRALLTAGGVVAAAVLAGGAYAAAHAIWSGHDMTPAGIERQATTVYNDSWDVCSGHNQCTTETGTHTEVTILPSMGVVFVLPDGDSTVIVPAMQVRNIPAAGLPGANGNPPQDDSGHTYGSAHPIGNWAGGVWKVPLPGGGERTITWHQATGAVTVVDSIGGTTTTTDLQTGDVVPLIPGTVTEDPRTLDKAVTFDLPTSTRVIIFPRLNETYIEFVHGPLMAEPLAPGEAAEYGLTPLGRYSGKLPVTANGGTWTAHLPDGLTRTISWHAGDAFVTVEDTTATGTTMTKVPIGHELPLVPFK